MYIKYGIIVFIKSRARNFCMKSISEVFNVIVVRPIHSLEKATIADLVQHAQIFTDSLHDADDTIRNEYKLELDIDCDMNYFTDTSFRYRFMDGSFITVFLK